MFSPVLFVPVFVLFQLFITHLIYPLSLPPHKPPVQVLICLQLLLFPPAGILFYLVQSRRIKKKPKKTQVASGEAGF